MLIIVKLKLCMLYKSFLDERDVLFDVLHFVYKNSCYRADSELEIPKKIPTFVGI